MAWLTDARPRLTDATGLLPVVVQDADSGEILMLAYANSEALAATERTGEAHLWSRSRNELWRKGATSGNVLRLVDISTDCDADAVRYRVHPAGPACHTGSRSCFPAPDARFDLPALATVIAERAAADQAESYTARLLAGGRKRPAQKVVEEAGEVALAAVDGTDDEVLGESADLLYHLLVVLQSRGLTLTEVESVLAERHAARG
jgi:phosphoribosyl-ATP pyrophosphohydrolase/phosphoribosyl-AMP cyclohydrolase